MTVDFRVMVLVGNLSNMESRSTTGQSLTSISHQPNKILDSFIEKKDKMVLGR